MGWFGALARIGSWGRTSPRRGYMRVWMPSAPIWVAVVETRT